MNQLALAVDVYVKAGAITSTLVDALALLGQLYPNHISVEDHFLLPLADELLSEVEQQVLGEMFRIVDSTKGEHARRSVKELSLAIKMCPSAVREENRRR